MTRHGGDSQTQTSVQICFRLREGIEDGDLHWLTDEQVVRLRPFSRKAMARLRLTNSAC
ncbi:hypothetical protein H845_3387 (plasmid) [Komagataeibacter xylinus E25]|uniref:Uncharacterized protein n=1 Tax=Komagataeibacter intermedius AF2 TaxID=1458464 RepID=A0A0N1F8Z9_9PROT|nr:hypothetical protein H845_3387 [Komagataeibacter xylinus E25]KPH85050.1 hypothetical protein GLUCOINTEAF2_0203613 [Komagataeibacter intermedius AF2]